MASSEDWIISESVQNAISTFASTTWEAQMLAQEVKELKQTHEGYDDALAEVTLEGSWLSIGEAFQLITDDMAAMAEMERRQKNVQERIDKLESKHKDVESVSNKVKAIIEAQLGERVRLNMD